MFMLYLEKAEEPEIKLPTSVGSPKKQESSRKTSTYTVWTTLKGFGIVNKAVDIFLELSCFFDDPVDVGNLISGSSAFSKYGLKIWKFTVHMLLKPGLENFEHYFTSM